MKTIKKLNVIVILILVVLFGLQSFELLPTHKKSPSNKTPTKFEFAPLPYTYDALRTLH